MDDEGAIRTILRVLRGVVDRHVKQRPRDTMLRNAKGDPARPLARRVAEHDACEICLSRANGSPVSPSSIDMEFHRFCRCHLALDFQDTRYRDRFASDEALRSVGVTMERGADPDWFEKRDALVLAASGRKVEFLKRHPSGSRRADALVDGELVEFKNPTSSGLFTVQNQILSCLYGKNKSVMKPQSDVLLVSNVRNSMTMADMQESLAAAFDERSVLSASERAAIRRVILLDERTRRVLVYDMDEDAGVAWLNGPRRRQGNTSTEAMEPQETGLTKMPRTASSAEKRRSPQLKSRIRLLGSTPAHSLSKDSVEGRLTDHARLQMEERGVSVEAIADADSNPLHRKLTRTDEYGRPSYQQIGQDATIVVNPDTNDIVSVWPTGTKNKRRYERNGNRGIVDEPDSTS